MEGWLGYPKNGSVGGSTESSTGGAKRLFISGQFGCSILGWDFSTEIGVG